MCRGEQALTTRAEIEALAHDAKRLADQGRIAEAKAAGAAAVQSAVENDGSEGSLTARVLQTASEIYFESAPEDWAEAVSFAERALAIHRRRSRYPDEDIAIARASHSLGRMLRRLGRTEEALGHLDAADKIFARLHEDGLRRLTTLPDLWECAVDLRRFDAALWAAEALFQLTPPEEPWESQVRHMLGLTLLELGRASEAAAHFARIVEIYSLADTAGGGNASAATAEAEEWLRRAESLAGTPARPTRLDRGS